MIDKIKNTLQHTIIYSIGNFATKIIGIVLLPLYTSHLTVADYGVLGILEATLIIFSYVFVFGQSSAVLRFFHLQENLDTRIRLISSVLAFLVVVNGVFLIFSWIILPSISDLFNYSQLFETYLKLIVSIVFFKTVNLVLLSILRAREKSLIYISSNVLKLLVLLSLNIYFVASLGLGVKGIMLAYLIGEVFLFITLIPTCFSFIRIRFSKNLLKATLNFGFPLIFTSLAAMLLNMENRYFLKLLINYHEAGLFNTGQKVAGILNILFVQSFSLGVLPLAYKAFGQKGDKRYFSKMNTYFIFVLVWAGLGISIFSREIVETFTRQEAYWAAAQIVPILIFSYILSGSNFMASLGMYLTKNTKYIAINNVIALSMSIIFSILLIPPFKMIGAAWATVLSFLFLYALSYIKSQKLYFIPFENNKTILVFLVGIVIYSCTSQIVFTNLVTNFIFKLVLLLIFPIILYPLKYYDKIEIDFIKNKLRRISP